LKKYFTVFLFLGYNKNILKKKEKMMKKSELKSLIKEAPIREATMD
jgi:hypothetical protein